MGDDRVLSRCRHVGRGEGRERDDRDFIQSTFDGLYFDADDRAFLDSAWSHIDRMTGAKQALAVSALVLSLTFNLAGLVWADC